jgi:hypothetical protein
MIQDLEGIVDVSQVVDPAVVTADVNGASVDLLGYEGVMFLVSVGQSGDTLSGSVKVELEVEESADDSTFDDAEDADLSTSVTGTNPGTFGLIDDAAEDDAVYVTSYKGDGTKKRYVRPVINVTGTHTNGIPIGIVAVRYGKKYKS